MNMDDLRNDGSSTDTEQDVSQSKSLLYHVYSNRGIQDSDPYKELDDWECSDDEIRLAYQLGAGSAADPIVRDKLATLTESGDREEWFTDLTVAMGHRIAQLIGRDTLHDGRDVKGAVPVMEQFSIQGGDIMDYLREHPEFITQLDTEELAELRDKAQTEQDGEEEPAPAEADD